MISIIIPAHNAFEYTNQCIDSIAENTYCDYEIIVVDNGSTDETKTYEGDGIRNFMKIRFDENRGFPKAINAGIGISVGEYVCILNNDTITTPCWLDWMIDHIENNECDIVSPCTNRISGKQQVYPGDYKNYDELKTIAIDFHKNNSGKLSLVNQVIGFCMVFKRNLIDTIGYFDERFGFGNSEDIDFCIRAEKEGYRIGIAQDVFIHHYCGVTHDLLKINYKEILDENHKKLIKKWESVNA